MVFIGALFIFLLQYPASTCSLTHPRHHHFSHSLLTDKAALLEFKKTIIFDPHSTLSNWDEAVHVCNFTGVKCDKFQHRVTELILTETHLVGLLSPFLSNLTGLHILDIVDNYLFGIIPPELSSLRRLHRLHLEGNNLHGSIPDSFSQLSKLNVLHIKDSNMSGSLSPSLFSNCTLEIVDLSSNFLNGKIPEEIGNCPGLWSLNLYNNQFTGQIPLSLTNLSLVNLDVEYNLLSGELPSEFPSSCSDLLYLHLSYNHLGTELDGKPARRELISNFPRITYKELSEATGGFDDQRQVGSGSYGHVYRGVLPDGTPIAVKVLHLKSGNSTKSFNRECQVLKRIRHRNLIRIITACSLPDFKALVLPYMAKGSLESRLYASPGSSDLSIIQRVYICSDIAEGLAYLHHHSPVKVIHCDLKPSNVLLNDDMTAVVSDFGIARLIMSVGGGNTGFNDNMGSSTTNLLCGSTGYIAPEYGFGSNTSTKGDVYSFGILVLEMVTRKRPTDDMFSRGLSLHQWVKIHYHGRLENVIDPAVVTASRDQSEEVKRMWEVAVVELIELGILCTQESPSTRPSMLDVADDLDRLKGYLTGDTTRTFASSLGILTSTRPSMLDVADDLDRLKRYLTGDTTGTFASSLGILTSTTDDF
ncbi:putative leucine-rich repeat receptor-like serine/threonine-protein kinase At2g24130 [Neltuma alba]|uniref:putative leucine-rich repeat receptor-like serine/threonine-protein kinase At2g24130 n=1 Tax=Neltuma alba TaxID=207710 RepID=UPI0010A4A647|nr:putative leucine-rich repeat receptor-like serine/threonine-protein kinase At2g24130 [Prosopis alba]